MYIPADFKIEDKEMIYDIIQDEYTIALQEVMMNRKSAQQALDEAERNVINRARRAGIL
jgi:hypothetical protein